jgi:ABC-type multidrug transport system ATPase subunit
LIEFDNVAKSYRPLMGPSVRAVHDFSLRISPGEVLGLAGPNGAGKSTLIALLLGYLNPTEGAIAIHGLRPRRYVTERGIGYMSELVAIPPSWSLEATLRRFGVLAGLAERDLRGAVEEAIARLGLEEHRGKRVRQLSKGTLQRLGLAQMLLRDEEVLILDEPTHGLDPVWTQHFRELMRELRRPDRILIIASHNLDELERVSDRVVIIDHGHLQRVVDVRATPGSLAPQYRLVLASGGEHVSELFPGAMVAGEGEYDIAMNDVASLNAALAALLARGAMITALTPSSSRLERHFHDVVRDSGK